MTVRKNTDERMRALERAFLRGDRDAGLRLAAMQSRFDPVLGAWTAWTAWSTRPRLKALQKARHKFMETNGFPWTGQGGRVALWRGPALITVWRQIDRWSGSPLAEDAYRAGAQRNDHIMVGKDKTLRVEESGPRTLDSLAYATGLHSMVDNLNDMSRQEVEELSGNIDIVDLRNFIECYAANSFSSWIVEALERGAVTLRDFSEYMEDVGAGYLSTEDFDPQLPGNEERIDWADTPLFEALIAVNSGLEPLNA